MGLDMYAYAVPEEFATDVTDVQFPENIKIGKEDLFYWRKHYGLHNWMEDLYRSRGGKAESFNCVNVRLDEDDLNELKKALLSGESSFSEYREATAEVDENIANDLSFIVAAKNAIDRGLAVFYDSWW